MSRPVIGIMGNFYLINDQYPAHAAGTMNCEAIVDLCEATPLIIPGDPKFVSVDELMRICDGFLFTGGRPNVHPSEYGVKETEAHGEFDRGRDAISLSLIKNCVKIGQPIFGICRGFQEVAVAFGSELHPEIREIPERDNHRMPPDGTLEEKFALRHEVTVSDEGPFKKIFGENKVLTNTLHGQGIMKPGKRVVIDGYAHDGTPEALYIADAPGFTLSVQWHPEYCAAMDPVSKPLFEAFGKATHDFHRYRNC